MKILAFDQASAVTGWSLFCDGELADYGKINLSKVKDSTERHRQMDIAVVELILARSPEQVVIEDVYAGKNMASLKVVARTQGLIMGYCHCNNIRCELIMPTAWRRQLKFQQGPDVVRSELKKQAQKYALDSFELKVTQDEADAICIGLAAVRKYERGR